MTSPTRPCSTPTSAAERRAAGEATRWLSPEDQRVLDLWWRETAGLLSRAELAGGLGLSQPHVAVRVQRMKERFALARTLLRAWYANPRCPGLAGAAAKLGGPTDPRWLSRLSRHVRRCEVCSAYERELIPAEHLLAGASVAPVIAALVGTTAKAGALGGAAPGWAVGDLLQRAARYLMAKFLPIGGVAAVSAAIVVIYAVNPSPSPSHPRNVANPPPQVTSSPAPTRSVSAAPVAERSSRPPKPTAFTGVTTASFYVAPGGNDANPGSITRPFATIAMAVSVVHPGQTIALRGGVYRPDDPVEITRAGSAGKRIVLSNYRNEKPVIDASDVPGDTAFITHRAGYWTVQGLEVLGAPSHAYLCRSCQHNIFRALTIHDSGKTGLLLSGRDTVDNKVLDSDFFRTNGRESAGENADGLGIENGSGSGNVVRGCRLYENADDGVGLDEFTSPVTIETTWSFRNGVDRWNISDFEGDGYGFQLGGGDSSSTVDHVIRNSAAWDNTNHGFSDSGNDGALTVRNNTAFRNGKAGFDFAESKSVLRNNVAVDNDEEANLGESVDSADNSWDGNGWRDALLRTTDERSTLSSRSPEGRLPRTSFLTNSSNDRIGAPMAPAR